MTSTMKAEIACPRCGAPSQAELWTTVNAGTDPDAAQWLIDGFLFQHECPSCGAELTLNHDCVYHDPASGFMIAYVADDADSAAALSRLEARKPEGYAVRLVASRDQLREKAAILRDGLDDRAVEVAKQAVLNRFVASGAVVRDARALYGARDEDGGIVVEFVSEGSTTETTVPADVYAGIADSFTDAQPSVVDAQWAQNVLSNWDDE